jgi:hypothetical protein
LGGSSRKAEEWHRRAEWQHASSPDLQKELTMNRVTFGLAIFSTVASLVATPALAESSCGPRADIVAKLAQEFKENQQAVGFVNENAVLEVFVSGTGSWTIIATGTDGKSCLLSAGQDWESAGFVKGLDTAFHPAANRQ